MNGVKRILQSSIALALCCLARTTALCWTTSRTITPAERVHEASHIVVGTVQDNPPLPCDPKGIFYGFVKADRYLKGTGPATIRILSFNGICLQSDPDGTCRQVSIGGLPSGELPATGERVLLLLKRLSDSGFQPVMNGIARLYSDTEAGVLQNMELLVEQERRPGD